MRTYAAYLLVVLAFASISTNGGLWPTNPWPGSRKLSSSLALPTYEFVLLMSLCRGLDLEASVCLAGKEGNRVADRSRPAARQVPSPVCLTLLPQSSLTSLTLLSPTYMHARPRRSATLQTSATSWAEFRHGRTSLLTHVSPTR